MGVEWYSVVVLVSISLMISEVEHLFMATGHWYSFFEEIAMQVLCPLITKLFEFWLYVALFWFLQRMGLELVDLPHIIERKRGSEMFGNLLPVTQLVAGAEPQLWVPNFLPFHSAMLSTPERVGCGPPSSRLHPSRRARCMVVSRIDKMKAADDTFYWHSEKGAEDWVLWEKPQQHRENQSWMVKDSVITANLTLSGEKLKAFLLGPASRQGCPLPLLPRSTWSCGQNN